MLKYLIFQLISCHGYRETDLTSFLNFYVFFNWRITAVLNCLNLLNFCQTSIWISHRYTCASVKVAQSCLILYDPMDYTVHGILQARKLEWVAFPFSRVSSQLRGQTQVSRIAWGIFTSRAAREAHRYTYVASLLVLPPISLPIPSL